MKLSMPVQWRCICACILLLSLPTKPATAEPEQGRLPLPTRAEAALPELDLDPAPQSDEAFVREIVEKLASAEMQGRRVGTEGEALALAYLEARLSELGITALPEARSMQYGFSITEGVQVAGEPRLSISDGTLARQLTYGTDYVIAPFSGSGSAEKSELLFAGYGISAPELGWNDFAGLDVAGKALLVVRGEPQEDDPASLFAGTQSSIYSDLRRKAAYARDLGATALIVIANPLSAAPDEELPALTRSYSATNFDIPVLHVKRDMIEELMAPGMGGVWFEQLLRQREASPETSWPELLEAAAEAMPGVPPSMPGSPAPTGGKALERLDLTFDIHVEKDLATGTNIVGHIPGTDPALAEQYFVIGAHYDHIGHGGMESTAPSRFGEIHYGADDNASGVAAVLEIAKRIKAQGGLRRPVLLCFFSGEEEGLIGSSALTKNFPLPLENAVAMLNFDMVGRLREDRLTLGGTATAAEFDPLLAGLEIEHGLNIAKDATGFGGSDQMSFIREGVPSLFFFTGTHSEYHNPDDTAEKINYPGILRIAAFAGDVLGKLDAAPGRLSFVKPEGGMEPARNRAGLAVTMGTVPSYEDHEEPGFHLSDVRPGGPAEKAGLKGGDIILRMLDRRIGNIYDFIYVLQDCVPGQTIPVLIKRGDEELELQVTLEARGVER